MEKFLRTIQQKPGAKSVQKRFAFTGTSVLCAEQSRISRRIISGTTRMANLFSDTKIPQKIYEYSARNITLKGTNLRGRLSRIKGCSSGWDG